MDALSTGLIAGGSLLGGAMDYFGSQRARRRQERILNEIRGISTASLKANADAFAQAFPHLSGAIDTARKAGAQALQANTQAGATASRFVGEQARGATREARAELARRGLGSTSSAAGVGGGIARQAGRAMGEIGERVGANNAGILQDTGARVSAGQFGLGGAIIDKGARDVAIRQNLASALGNVQYESQGGAASALGQLGGMAALLRESWKTQTPAPGGGQWGNFGAR